MGIEELTGSVSGVLSGRACTNLGCVLPALWLVLIERQLLTGRRQKACRLTGAIPAIARYHAPAGQDQDFRFVTSVFCAPLFLHLVYKNYSMMRSLRVSIAILTLISTAIISATRDPAGWVRLS